MNNVEIDLFAVKLSKQEHLVKDQLLFDEIRYQDISLFIKFNHAIMTSIRTTSIRRDMAMEESVTAMIASGTIDGIVSGEIRPTCYVQFFCRQSGTKSSGYFHKSMLSSSLSWL